MRIDLRRSRKLMEEEKDFGERRRELSGGESIWEEREWKFQKKWVLGYKDSGNWNKKPGITDLSLVMVWIHYFIYIYIHRERANWTHVPNNAKAPSQSYHLFFSRSCISPFQLPGWSSPLSPPQMTKLSLQPFLIYQPSSHGSLSVLLHWSWSSCWVVHGPSSSPATHHSLLFFFFFFFFFLLLPSPLSEVFFSVSSFTPTYMLVLYYALLSLCMSNVWPFFNFASWHCFYFAWIQLNDWLRDTHSVH